MGDNGVESLGFGWLRVVMGGYEWSWVVLGSYG